VPQFSNRRTWDIRFCQPLAFAQFDSAMWSDETRSAPLLHRLAGVGPCKRVSHRCVVVIHELPQLLFQGGDRREVSAAQQLAVDDSEYDFDLV
jgi:hypothetical protein